MKEYNINSNINLTRNGFYGGPIYNENIEVPINIYLKLVSSNINNKTRNNRRTTNNRRIKKDTNVIMDIINRAKYIEMYKKVCIRCGKNKLIKHKELCKECEKELESGDKETIVSYIKK